MSQKINRRIVLASRPEGRPTAENFRLEQAALPLPVMARFCCACAICRSIPICAGA